MRAPRAALALLAFASALAAVEVGGLKPVGAAGGFEYFAEDGEDYSELFPVMAAANARFAAFFGKRPLAGVRVYLFADQRSFSKGVFGADGPVMDATGFADYVQNRIFATSFHDTCKPKERLLKTPLHELAHLYFRSDAVWLREGTASYLAGILEPYDPAELPASVGSMKFSGKDTSPAEFQKAYNQAAWLVKFIVEECCAGKGEAFLAYAKKPGDFAKIGFSSEKVLFAAWRMWMTRRVAG